MWNPGHISKITKLPTRCLMCASIYSSSCHGHKTSSHDLIIWPHHLTLSHDLVTWTRHMTSSYDLAISRLVSHAIKNATCVTQIMMTSQWRNVWNVLRNNNQKPEVVWKMKAGCGGIREKKPDLPLALRRRCRLKHRPGWRLTQPRKWGSWSSSAR